MRCPETGREMVRGVRPMTISYKGAEHTFDMPGWYIDGANEGVHSGEDMKVSDRELNVLKARVEDLLDPGQIREIRKRLGLTQREAGVLIAGGPNAFQKYEAGVVLVSRGVTTALRILSRHPEEVQYLREAKEINRTQHGMAC